MWDRTRTRVRAWARARTRGIALRMRGGDAQTGMSTAEYAVGTIVI